MTALVLPSEALSGSFVLSTTDDDQDRAEQAQQTATFVAYGLIVGNIGLLLPTHIASMVVEGKVPFCELPNAPVGLQGMVNINGNILPVFNLGVMLGIAETESSELKMIMIGHGEDAFAITVAHLPVRVRLNAAHQLIGKPPLPAAIQPFAKSCYKTDRLWVDWDLQEFFSSSDFCI